MTKVEQDKLLSMREILLTAIKREEEAYTFYISARQCARTPTEGRCHPICRPGDAA